MLWALYTNLTLSLVVLGSTLRENLPSYQNHVKAKEANVEVDEEENEAGPSRAAAAGAGGQRGIAAFFQVIYSKIDYCTGRFFQLVPPPHGPERRTRLREGPNGAAGGRGVGDRASAGNF